MQVANRQGIVEKVRKSHGGPIISEEEVLELIRVTPKEKIQKLLADEITYQRDIMYESRAVIDKTVFVCRKKDADGKSDNLSILTAHDN